MAKKCDFCGSQRSDGSCGSCSGSNDCKEAARLYARYMTAQAESRSTKNINVNKRYK